MNQALQHRSPCLITGAGGFIGTRLCEMISASGTLRLRALVRRRESLAGLTALGVDVHLGNLLDSPAAQRALAGCRSVVHLAHDGEHGAQATRNLVTAAAASGIEHFVHISSMSVHGPAPGPDATDEATATIGRYDHDYCDSKAEQEEVVRTAFDQGLLRGVILRPTVVYGAGSAFVRLVLDQARAGSLNCFDQGRGRANLVYVDDVCTAIQAALTTESALGQAVFINGDEDVSWRDFIVAIADLVAPGAPMQDLSAAEAIAWWTAHPRERPPRHVGQRLVHKLRRLFSGPPAPAPWPPLGRVQRETVSVFFRNDRAKQLLGWQPRFGFAQGVAATADALHLR